MLRDLGRLYRETGRVAEGVRSCTRQPRRLQRSARKERQAQRNRRPRCWDEGQPLVALSSSLAHHRGLRPGVAGGYDDPAGSSGGEPLV